MLETNPYDASSSNLDARCEKTFARLRDKWLGLLGIVGGISILVYQLWLFAATKTVITWLIGGGMGVLIIGVLQLAAYLSDKQYSKQVN